MKGVPESTFNIAVQSLFGFISVATGNEHWQRTEEQCRMVSDPLSRISQTWEPSRIEEIQKYQDYALLLTGAAMLTIPSITLELQLRKGAVSVVSSNQNTHNRESGETVGGFDQFAGINFAGTPQTRNGTY